MQLRPCSSGVVVSFLFIVSTIVTMLFMITLSLLTGLHAFLSLRRITRFCIPFIPRHCTPQGLEARFLSVTFHSLNMSLSFVTRHVRMIAIRHDVLGLG